MHIRTLAAAGILAGATVAGIATPALASAGPLPHNDQVTVTAFWRYEHHRTDHNFNHMYVLSRHADTYLRVDIGQWQRDRAHHAPAKVLARDEHYVWLDVTQPAD